MKYIFAVVFSFTLLPAFPQSPALLSSAQQSPAPLFTPTVYPQDYFRDPLDIPMSLAANFGELRPNHYHMGLDIRTRHRENLPVHAAADGYIARVEIQPEGFGQAIYIRHPNGYTTVYGHLRQFTPALAAYVREQQYRQQSWQADLTIPPGLFPVKKGELIAYSGNTGGSQGPHLHFEIRLTAGDINLNPLLFGLPVPDHTPPVILRLAWYDRNQGIYDQSPHILPVRKSAGKDRARFSALFAQSSQLHHPHQLCDCCRHLTVRAVPPIQMAFTGPIFTSITIPLSASGWIISAMTTPGTSTPTSTIGQENWADRFSNSSFFYQDIRRPRYTGLLFCRYNAASANGSDSSQRTGMRPIPSMGSCIWTMAGSMASA